MTQVPPFPPDPNLASGRSVSSPVRRAFLFGSAAAALATSLRAAEADGSPPAADPKASLTYPFAVPALPYAAGANEPWIDAETMQLHHDKHHAGYVTNLNAALEHHADLHGLGLQELLARSGDLPGSIRATVRNNAGGHANHTMFWQVLGGRGGAPEGDLRAAITRDFGSFEALRSAFDKAATGVFGSGWAMVVMDRDGKLALASMPNQDSPLMEGRSVLFGNDVWEHAYYVKYRNRRADYLAAWWNVLDWTRIGARHAQARSGPIV